MEDLPLDKFGSLSCRRRRRCLDSNTSFLMRQNQPRSAMCWTKISDADQNVTPRFPKLHQRPSRLMSTIVEETYSMYTNKSKSKKTDLHLVNTLKVKNSSTSQTTINMLSTTNSSNDVGATSLDVESLTLCSGSKSGLNTRSRTVPNMSTTKIQDHEAVHMKTKLKHHKKHVKRSLSNGDMYRRKFTPMDIPKEAVSKPDKKNPPILAVIASEIFKGDLTKDKRRTKTRPDVEVHRDRKGRRLKTVESKSENRIEVAPKSAKENIVEARKRSKSKPRREKQAKHEDATNHEGKGKTRSRGLSKSGSRRRLRRKDRVKEYDADVANIAKERKTRRRSEEVEKRKGSPKEKIELGVGKEKKEKSEGGGARAKVEDAMESSKLRRRGKPPPWKVKRSLLYFVDSRKIKSNLKPLNTQIDNACNMRSFLEGERLGSCDTIGPKSKVTRQSLGSLEIPPFRPKAPQDIPEENLELCSNSLTTIDVPPEVPKDVSVCKDVVEASVAKEAQEPKSFAVEEPKSKVVEEPKSNAVEEPKSNAVEEPKSNAVEEPKSNAVEQPKCVPELNELASNEVCGNLSNQLSENVEVKELDSPSEEGEEACVTEILEEDNVEIIESLYARPVFENYFPNPLCCMTLYNTVVKSTKATNTDIAWTSKIPVRRSATKCVGPDHEPPKRTRRSRIPRLRRRDISASSDGSSASALLGVTVKRRSRIPRRVHTSCPEKVEEEYASSEAAPVLLEEEDNLIKSMSLNFENVANIDEEIFDFHFSDDNNRKIPDDVKEKNSVSDKNVAKSVSFGSVVRISVSNPSISLSLDDEVKPVKKSSSTRSGLPQKASKPSAADKTASPSSGELKSRLPLKVPPSRVTEPNLPVSNVSQSCTIPIEIDLERAVQGNVSSGSLTTYPRLTEQDNLKARKLAKPKRARNPFKAWRRLIGLFRREDRTGLRLQITDFHPTCSIFDLRVPDRSSSNSSLVELIDLASKSSDKPKAVTCIFTNVIDRSSSSDATAMQLQPSSIISELQNFTSQIIMQATYEMAKPLYSHLERDLKEGRIVFKKDLEHMLKIPITHASVGVSYYTFKSYLRKYMYQKEILRMLLPCIRGMMSKAPKIPSELLVDPEPVLEKVSSIDCKEEEQDIPDRYSVPEVFYEDEDEEDLPEDLPEKQREMLRLQTKQSYIYEIIHTDESSTESESMKSESIKSVPGKAESEPSKPESVKSEPITGPSETESIKTDSSEIVSIKSESINSVHSEVVSITPESIKSEPVQTESIKSAPISIKSEPIKSESIKSEPIKSESIKSEPIKSESIKSEPMKSESIKSEPIKSESIKSVPIKSESIKSEPIKSESIKSEPIKSESIKSEPIKSESIKSEPMKTESIKSEPIKSESIKSVPIKSESIKSEPIKSESIKSEPIKSESIKYVPIKSDSIKSEPIKPESIKSESIKSESIKSVPKISESVIKPESIESIPSVPVVEMAPSPARTSLVSEETIGCSCAPCPCAVQQFELVLDPDNLKDGVVVSFDDHELHILVPPKYLRSSRARYDIMDDLYERLKGDSRFVQVLYDVTSYGSVYVGLDDAVSDYRARRLTRAVKSSVIASFPRYEMDAIKLRRIESAYRNVLGNFELRQNSHSTVLSLDCEDMSPPQPQPQAQKPLLKPPSPPQSEPCICASLDECLCVCVTREYYSKLSYAEVVERVGNTAHIVPCQAVARRVASEHLVMRTEAPGPLFDAAKNESVQMGSDLLSGDELMRLFRSYEIHKELSRVPSVEQLVSDEVPELERQYTNPKSYEQRYKHKAKGEFEPERRYVEMDNFVPDIKRPVVVYKSEHVRNPPILLSLAKRLLGRKSDASGVKRPRKMDNVHRKRRRVEQASSTTSTSSEPTKVYSVYQLSSDSQLGKKKKLTRVSRDKLQKRMGCNVAADDQSCPRKCMCGHNLSEWDDKASLNACNCKKKSDVAKKQKHTGSMEKEAEPKHVYSIVEIVPTNLKTQRSSFKEIMQRFSEHYFKKKQKKYRHRDVQPELKVLEKRQGCQRSAIRSTSTTELKVDNAEIGVECKFQKDPKKEILHPATKAGVSFDKNAQLVQTESSYLRDMHSVITQTKVTSVLDEEYKYLDSENKKDAYSDVTYSNHSLIVNYSPKEDKKNLEQKSQPLKSDQAIQSFEYKVDDTEQNMYRGRNELKPKELVKNRAVALNSEEFKTGVSSRGIQSYKDEDALNVNGDYFKNDVLLKKEVNDKREKFPDKLQEQATSFKDNRVKLFQLADVSDDRFVSKRIRVKGGVDKCLSSIDIPLQTKALDKSVSNYRTQLHVENLDKMMSNYEAEKENRLNLRGTSSVDTPKTAAFMDKCMSSLEASEDPSVRAKVSPSSEASRENPLDKCMSNFGAPKRHPHKTRLMDQSTSSFGPFQEVPLKTKPLPESDVPFKTKVMDKCTSDQENPLRKNVVDKSLSGFGPPFKSSFELPKEDPSKGMVINKSMSGFEPPRETPLRSSFKSNIETPKTAASVMGKFKSSLDVAKDTPLKTRVISRAEVSKEKHVVDKCTSNFEAPKQHPVEARIIDQSTSNFGRFQEDPAKTNFMPGSDVPKETAFKTKVVDKCTSNLKTPPKENVVDMSTFEAPKPKLKSSFEIPKENSSKVRVIHKFIPSFEPPTETLLRSKSKSSFGPLKGNLYETKVVDKSVSSFEPFAGAANVMMSRSVAPEKLPLKAVNVETFKGNQLKPQAQVPKEKPPLERTPPSFAPLQENVNVDKLSNFKTANVECGTLQKERSKGIPCQELKKGQKIYDAKNKDNPVNWQYEDLWNAKYSPKGNQLKPQVQVSKEKPPLEKTLPGFAPLQENPNVDKLSGFETANVECGTLEKGRSKGIPCQELKKGQKIYDAKNKNNPVNWQYDDLWNARFSKSTLNVKPLSRTDKHLAALRTPTRNRLQVKAVDECMSILEAQRYLLGARNSDVMTASIDNSLPIYPEKGKRMHEDDNAVRFAKKKSFKSSLHSKRGSSSEKSSRSSDLSVLRFPKHLADRKLVAVCQDVTSIPSGGLNLNDDQKQKIVIKTKSVEKILVDGKGNAAFARVDSAEFRHFSSGTSPYRIKEKFITAGIMHGGSSSEMETQTDMSFKQPPNTDSCNLCEILPEDRRCGLKNCTKETQNYFLDTKAKSEENKKVSPGHMINADLLTKNRSPPVQDTSIVAKKPPVTQNVEAADRRDPFNADLLTKNRGRPVQDTSNFAKKPLPGQQAPKIEAADRCDLSTCVFQKKAGLPLSTPKNYQPGQQQQPSKIPQPKRLPVTETKEYDVCELPTCNYQKTPQVSPRHLCNEVVPIYERHSAYKIGETSTNAVKVEGNESESYQSLSSNEQLYSVLVENRMQIEPPVRGSQSGGIFGKVDHIARADTVQQLAGVAAHASDVLRSDITGNLVPRWKVEKEKFPKRMNWLPEPKMPEPRKMTKSSVYRSDLNCGYHMKDNREPFFNVPGTGGQSGDVLQLNLGSIPEEQLGCGTITGVLKNVFNIRKSSLVRTASVKIELNDELLPEVGDTRLSTIVEGSEEGTKVKRDAPKGRILYVVPRVRDKAKRVVYVLPRTGKSLLEKLSGHVVKLMHSYSKRFKKLVRHGSGGDDGSGTTSEKNKNSQRTINSDVPSLISYEAASDRKTWSEPVQVDDLPNVLDKFSQILSNIQDKIWTNIERTRNDIEGKKIAEGYEGKSSLENFRERLKREKMYSEERSGEEVEPTRDRWLGSLDESLSKSSVVAVRSEEIYRKTRGKSHNACPNLDTGNLTDMEKLELRNVERSIDDPSNFDSEYVLKVHDYATSLENRLDSSGRNADYFLEPTSWSLEVLNDFEECFGGRDQHVRYYLVPRFDGKGVRKS